MKAAKTIFESTYKKSPQLLKTVGLKKMNSMASSTSTSGRRTSWWRYSRKITRALSKNWRTWN